MILYGITSYHRPDCFTVNTLTEIGVPKDRILICLNDDKDLPEYTRRWGRFANVVCKKKRNLAGNRNNVLEYAGDGFDPIILDDDLLSFRLFDPTYKKSGRWNKIETVTELDALLEECFAKAREVGAGMFGMTSVTHCLSTKQALSKDGKWGINKNFAGGFLGFPDKSIRFDEEWDLQEDYELNLRIISEGGTILRRNGLTAYRCAFMKTEGGCKEFYDAGLKPIFMKKLQEKYPAMFKFNKNGEGIRFTWR